MHTFIQIIGVIIAVPVIAIVAILFGVPSWVPIERKPDRETMVVIGVIIGLIILMGIGAIAWEKLM